MSSRMSHIRSGCEVHHLALHPALHGCLKAKYEVCLTSQPQGEIAGIEASWALLRLCREHIFLRAIGDGAPLDTAG